LREVRHRPWPIPDEPWRWSQTWNDLAFLHWRVDRALLRPLVPDSLTIDECDGTAWVALTPFWISGATLRGLPPIPSLSTFPETNVRTYVTYGERPGVWFFSLDAQSHLAVFGARLLFGLPYVHADIAVKRDGEAIDYDLRRRSGVRFSARYNATGAAQHAIAGTLEHFLTERYCLYAHSAGGGLHRAEIQHVPWPLQRARVHIRQNDLLAANGLGVSGDPLVHYAARLDVVIWPLRLLVAGAAGPAANPHGLGG
jgi:hypothetical protein